MLVKLPHIGKGKGFYTEGKIILKYKSRILPGSDIWYKHYESYFEIVIRNFETRQLNYSSVTVLPFLLIILPSILFALISVFSA